MSPAKGMPPIKGQEKGQFLRIVLVIVVDMEAMELTMMVGALIQVGVWRMDQLRSPQILGLVRITPQVVAR